MKRTAKQGWRVAIAIMPAIAFAGVWSVCQVQSIHEKAMSRGMMAKNKMICPRFVSMLLALWDQVVSSMRLRDSKALRDRSIATLTMADTSVIGTIQTAQGPSGGATIDSRSAQTTP